MSRAPCKTNKPEVLHEVPELVHPPRQGHDDVDQRVGHVELLLLHFHDGAKGPEQDKALEFMVVVPFEGELIQSAFIPFCSVYPCKAKRAKVVSESELWLFSIVL